MALQWGARLKAAPWKRFKHSNDISKNTRQRPPCFQIIKTDRLNPDCTKTCKHLVERTFTVHRRVMQHSFTSHQQNLAPAQWALPHIHHVSFLVHEDGTDLMHWMRNYLLFHMPVLVIAFSGSCQILSFANKGHMFPQRKIWQTVRWWFCSLIPHKFVQAYYCFTLLS